MIELMLTIGILAIIAAIALPTYRQVTISSAAATQANNFLGTLNHARSEAAKRGMKVVVCKSADGATCDTANDWQEGWIEFVDASGNNAREPATEALIAAHPAVANFSITADGSVTDHVPYYPSGISRSSGNIYICNETGAGTVASRKRKIVIIASGRARIDVMAKQAGCP